LKFDDKRAMHKKLRRAGFAARGLDEAAICQSGAEETDGFIDDVTLALLGTAHGESPKSLAKLAAILCSPEVDRWMRDDQRGGYVIKDYLVYNASHEELEDKREKDRQRKRPGIPQDSERNPSGVAEDSNALRTDATRNPSRPVPTRPLEDSDADASSSSGDDDEDPIFTEALRRYADRKMLGKTIDNRAGYRAKTIATDRIEFSPLRAAHPEFTVDELLEGFMVGAEGVVALTWSKQQRAEARRNVILGQLDGLRRDNVEGVFDSEIAELEAEFMSLRIAAGVTEVAS
jgi:hypothetical protein